MHARLLRDANLEFGDTETEMLDLFDYALALNAHRNFARAAKQLGISQPTLTRGIQELEELLGARLFDRTSRGVFPTVIGEKVIEGGRSISQSFEDLKQDVRSYERLERAELKVGVGPLVAQTWMPDASNRASFRNIPSIEIQLLDIRMVGNGSSNRNRHLELAICEIADTIERHSDIVVTPFRIEHWRSSAEQGTR